MKRMTKGKGNGHGGGDLIVKLHGEVLELREALARQYQEMVTAMGRHHRETDGHLARIGRMVGYLGDRVSDHERRLSIIEEKVG